MQKRRLSIENKNLSSFHSSFFLISIVAYFEYMKASDTEYEGIQSIILLVLESENLQWDLLLSSKEIVSSLVSIRLDRTTVFSKLSHSRKIESSWIIFISYHLFIYSRWRWIAVVILNRLTKCWKNVDESDLINSSAIMFSIEI